MNKELFEKLAYLRLAERDIKDQIDEILPTINESVKELERGTIIKTPAGTFTVSLRRTYTYSKDVEEKEVELKKLKKEEEQKGLATHVEKASVVFKAAGEVEE